MDKKQLTMIAGIGGAATALGVILPWVTFSAGPMSVSANGFDAPMGWLIFLGALVAAAIFGLTALGKGSVIPMPDKQKVLIGMIAMAVAGVIMLLKFLDFSGGGVVSRGIGMWIGLLGAIAGTGGAVLLFTGKTIGGGGGGGGGGEA